MGMGGVLNYNLLAVPYRQGELGMLCMVPS